jgi:hypothetical protein
MNSKSTCSRSTVSGLVKLNPRCIPLLMKTHSISGCSDVTSSTNFGILSRAAISKTFVETFPLYLLARSSRSCVLRPIAITCVPVSAYFSARANPMPVVRLWAAERHTGGCAEKNDLFVWSRHVLGSRRGLTTSQLYSQFRQCEYLGGQPSFIWPFNALVGTAVP